MYSPPWIVIITAIHLLHSSSSFCNTIENLRRRQSRCNHPLNDCNSEEKDTSSLSEWHYIPRDILLNDVDNKDMAHRCDAIVNKLNLNMNDNILDQDVWARTFQSQSANKIYDVQNDGASIQNSHNDTSTVPPIQAMEAIEASYRWSENFVRQLSLCPWAGSSLDAVGAIRYWVLLVDDINDDDIQNNKIILDRMEDILRDAGKHLKQITSSADDYLMHPIDPAVAISFVILVSSKSSIASSQQPNHLEFGDFHDFFLNLEDKLLDECDEYWEQIDNTDEDTLCNNKVPIGCDITVAGFHPNWQFGSEDGSSSDQSIDYEKRTPYPTISIVMSGKSAFVL